MTEDSRSVGAFRVAIYHGRSQEPCVEYVGTGDEWLLKPVLPARVFGDAYTVRVDGAWAGLLRGRELRIEKEVEGLRTEVKFGDTLQLRETFRVVIELEP